MRLETHEDYMKHRTEQDRLISALRCMGEEYIDKVMPDCVKVLVNECNTLGETLMRHTLH